MRRQSFHATHLIGGGDKAIFISDNVVSKFEFISELSRENARANEHCKI